MAMRCNPIPRVAQAALDDITEVQEMFDKVLVAVDGSQYSDAALTAAEGFAAKTGSTVEVVHVHEHDFIPSKAGMSPDLEPMDEAKAVIDRAVERLKGHGVSVTGRLLQARTRDVPRAIIEAAEESGADLIIVGRRGLSSLTGMLVGSVSNKLIHVAKVPIMVAH
jgi:nucleotide-binding universal stress UspA family protein